MAAMQSITRALTRAIAPLRLALSDQDQLIILLDDIGWTVGDLEDNLTETQQFLTQQVFSVGQDIDALFDLMDQLEASDSLSAADLQTLVSAAQSILVNVKGLSSLSESDILTLPHPLNTVAFWTELALDLPEFLVIRYLRWYAPVLHGLLYFAGIIEDREPPLPDSIESGQVLRWQNLSACLQDPAQYLASYYGWGSDDFRHERLIDALSRLAIQSGVPTDRRRLRSRLRDAFVADGHPDAASLYELDLPIFEGSVGAGESEAWAVIGAIFAAIPSDHVSDQAQIDSLYLGNLTEGSAETTIELSDDWALTLDGELDASGSVGVSISPDQPAAFEGMAADVNAAIALAGEPETPWTLLGDPDGLRVELHGFDGGVRLIGDTSDLELILELGAGGGLDIVLDFSQGDGFISQIFGGQETRIEADAKLLWSTKTGLAIEGGAGFDVQLPLQKPLGPVTIDWLRLSMAADGAGLRITAGVTGRIELGPITAVAEELGLTFSAVPTGDDVSSGDFAGLNLALDFKPPAGVGLVIDAPAISGGGYLRFFPEQGEYSGVAELTLGEDVALTAVGILSTQMPDGGPGWSMLLSITSQFAPLPIGFGFTLIGVGGLIGVNRGMDTDALAAGLRAGTLDSILFPEDVVANAPAILSDMATVFPTVRGQFVFGPMLKLGWGSPTVMTASLGVFIQLPDPITVAILGQIETILPDEELALIVLRLDVLGVIDLTNGTLAIDASLRESEIVGFPLAGDMALRAAFLDSPSFLMAIGGFHPAFDKPDSFPTLRRLSIAIDAGDALQIGFECYLAVTSNTVQFGAALSFHAESSNYALDGGLAFDALFTLKPFSFTIYIGFHLAVTKNGNELMGIFLEGQLSGPKPWHVIGRAQFTFLGLEVAVQIDQTIGQTLSASDALSIPLESDLLAALSAPDAWQATMPPGSPLVQLADSGGTKAHPSASLEVSQRLVPLGVSVERFGEAAIDGANEFVLDNATLGGAEVEAEPVEAWFAPAQYFTLRDEEKLCSPSFERMASGLRFVDDGASAGEARSASLMHKQRVRDPNMGVHNADDGEHPATDTSLQRGRRRKFARRRARPDVTEQRFNIEPMRYAVADIDSGQVSDGQSGLSHIAARRMTSRAEHVAPLSELVE